MSQSMTTVSELVDKGDIPEERKDNVKNILHDLGYAASRAVGKAGATSRAVRKNDSYQQLTRIEAATLNTFHHMFAPSISDLSQRSRYLQDDMIKASHIYKRDWPAQTAAQLKLDVDTAANLFSAQKKIENAFDKSRPLLCPTICQTTYCIFWTLHWVLR
ncbi:hypothetical protein WJX82_001984 [Trebouxia sp. C0006]